LEYTKDKYSKKELKENENQETNIRR